MFFSSQRWWDSIIRLQVCVHASVCCEQKAEDQQTYWNGKLFVCLFVNWQHWWLWNIQECLPWCYSVFTSWWLSLPENWLPTKSKLLQTSESHIFILEYADIFSLDRRMWKHFNSDKRWMDTIQCSSWFELILLPGRWSTWSPLEGGFQKILISWIYPDPNDLCPQSPVEVKRYIYETLSLSFSLSLCVRECGPTLASRLSCGALTPKRGMQAGAKLGLCVTFFTPLICDMGLFFFSLSFGGGDRISTSCCFSAICT